MAATSVNTNSDYTTCNIVDEKKNLRLKCSLKKLKSLFIFVDKKEDSIMGYFFLSIFSYNPNIHKEIEVMLTSCW